MVRHYRTQFRDLPANLKLFVVGHAVQAFGHAVHALLFNLFLREAGMKEGVMGALASTTSLGVALMAFPSAFVLERFAVKPMLVLGMAMAAGFYLMQVQASTVEMWTFFGLLGAMGTALFNISVAPFILRNTTPEQRVYGYTFNSSAVMGAQLLGYIVGGKVPEALPLLFPDLPRIEAFRWAMTAALGVSFLSFFAYARILRVPAPRLRAPLIGQMREKDWRTLGKLIAPKVCIALGAGMIIPFMNVYLSKRFDMGSSAVGMCFSIAQLCMFTGIFLSPLVVKRMDRLKFILTTAMLSVPFMLAMTFASSFGLVLGSFFMRGMLMNMSGPMTSMFEMERVREQDCLFASSILIFCYNVAWTFSTQVGGWLIETHGFRPSFLIAAAFYTSAVGCYWAFFRTKRAGLNPQRRPLPAPVEEAA